MFKKVFIALCLCAVSSAAQAQKILVNTNSGTSVEYNLAERDPNTGGLPTCTETLDDTESALGDATGEVAALREELAVVLEATDALAQELVAVYEENDALIARVADLEDDLAVSPEADPEEGLTASEADSDSGGDVFSIEYQENTLLSYQP
jgi:hypothetical protein